MHSISHAFAPLRVDVVPLVSGAGQGDKDEEVDGLKVQAWETFRGNDWDNKGESVGLEGGALRVRVMGQKAFLMERSSCESWGLVGRIHLHRIANIGLQSTF